MKRNLLFVIMLSMSTLLFAQRPYPGQGGRPQAGPSVTGKITGTLLDSVSESGMAYASVALLGGKENKVLNGTLTDESGRFKLADIKTGAYTLRFTSLGYKAFEVSVKTTPEKPDFDTGDIFISPTAVQLDAVEITGQASVIENKIDKIVYNADKDVTTVGGDAADVLRKVPLLSVDLEGNVSLRGSQNIRILVNGKPSGMFANNKADALKMIPAEEIKKVEVITTPTAKYDGEGSGGIINLITKKKQLEGISGSFNGAVGNLNNNGSLSLNAGIGRLSLTSNFSVRHSWPRESRSTLFRENFRDGMVINTLDQSGSGESFFNSLRGNAGAYYNFNAYNSLSSNFNIRGFNRGGDDITNVEFLDLDGMQTQNYVLNRDDESLRSGYDWTTDYIRTFKKKGQEFSVGVQVNGDISKQDIDLTPTGDFPSDFRQEITENDGDNLEITAQVDYVHPIKKGVKLETGLKAIIRDIDSDYKYDTLFRAENRYIRDMTRSNVFDYDQDVYSAYASFSLDFGKKYSAIVGARYEHTSIAGNFNQGNGKFSSEYDNLLPSIIVSRKLKGFSNIKLSFNQRIQRPSLFFLNPFRNEADRRNVTVGNPELEPEITDQYELGYTTIIKGATISASIYYRNTRDIIENIASIDEEGTTTTTYLNAGENDSWGTNVFASFTIKKVWTVRGGINVFTYDASGVINGDLVSRQAILWSGNLNTTLLLKKGFSLEAFGFLRSPRQTLQGSQVSFSIFSIGARKELFKKKGSIGIRVIEPWSKFKSFDGDFEQEGAFRQVTTRDILFRSYALSFSYRFGKLKSRAPRKRSKIRNDDSKSGGDNNNF